MSKRNALVLLVLVLSAFLMVGCDSGTDYSLETNMDAAAENLDEISDATCGTALNPDSCD